MAGYECSLCEGAEQATILITPLTGGETMAVGESCMAVAFTGMLAGHLAMDAELLWDAIVAAQDMATRERPDGTPKDQAGPAAEPTGSDQAVTVPPVAAATGPPAKRGPGRPRKPRPAAAHQGGGS